MEQNKKVKIKFYLKDDFGDEHIFYQSGRLDHDFEELNVFYLIRAFKKFLITAGYSNTTANKVTFDGATEEQKEEMAI